MDIASLFENAAAEVRAPAKAPHESLRCRAWYSRYCFAPTRRCDRIVEQGDGTCWQHRDYYKGWWTSTVPTSPLMEDNIMLNCEAEIRFQIQNGFVSLQDPELETRLRDFPHYGQFFMMLCEYSEFDYSAYPVHITIIVNKLTQHIIHRRQTYDQAFANLHRLFDRGYVFHHYLINCLIWVADNIKAGAPNVVEGLLYTANVTFRDIAGKRQMLALLFKTLRNEHIENDAEDDRYNMCRGRFWLWVSELKAAERAAYEPLREAVLAAAWAPARMPFWCLDVEEVAEDYPEGLPSKEEWKTLCAAC